MEVPLYTQLQSDQLSEILSHYDLGQSLEFQVCSRHVPGSVHNYAPPLLTYLFLVQRLNGGIANSNYRIKTDKGTYLLKVCDEKDKESLQVRSLPPFPNLLFRLNHSLFIDSDQGARENEAVWRSNLLSSQTGPRWTLRVRALLEQ